MKIEQNLSSICRTCLARDRTMIPLNFIEHLISTANLDIGSNGSLCWECHSILLKYFKFKNQVKAAQDYFNNLIKTNSRPKSLSKLTVNKKLTIDVHYTYGGDPLSDDENDIKLSDLTENIKKEQDFDNNYENSNDSEHFVAPNDPANLQDTNELDNKKERPKKNDSYNADKDDLTEENQTDNYTNVTLKEEEMLSKRERKRNEPNYKKLPYKCDSCVIGFTRKETYDVHFYKRHDKNIGEFTCDVCESRFKSATAAKRHRIKHSTFYKCKICKHETCELASVVAHCKMKHKRDTLNRIHCPDCSDLFKTHEELRAHRRIQHAVTCSQCAEVFISKGNLRAHMRRIHTIDREFTCQVCKKQFLSKSRLESHLVSHGGKAARELAYCAVCDVQYKSLSVYRSHLRNTTLHPRDTYECSECHKRFASRDYCRRHFAFFHLNKTRIKCDDCGKRFMSPWKLKEHQATRHGGDRTRDHKCNHCDKTFYSSKILKCHQLTHSSVRGFMCSECGDTFKQSAALYTHTRLVHKQLKRTKKRKE